MEISEHKRVLGTYLRGVDGYPAPAQRCGSLSRKSFMARRTSASLERKT
jgi:hypothetical protein